MNNRIITALATILAIPAMAAPAGYFQVPGTETTMKVYGKAETWGVYGFDGLTDVVANNTLDQSYNKSGKTDSWTLARLGVTSTTPSSFGDVNVKLEFQAKSASSNSASLNLRHAYGEFGGLLIGQTDSLFSAWHNSPNYYDSYIPDFYGTGRTRQIRYTLAPAKGIQVGFSMEQDRTGGEFTGMAPQLVAAFQYGADWGNVTASVGYQKKTNWTGYGNTLPVVDNQTQSGTGTSFAVSGAFNLGENDTFTAMIENGGNFYGFGDNAPDEVSDGFYAKSDTSLGFYKSTQWNLSYTHTWTPAVQSTIAVGQTMFKKDVNVAPFTLNKGTVTSILLGTTYAVTKSTLFGGEFTYDQAKQTDSFVNKTGDVKSNRTDKRMKLFFRYNFF